MRHHIHVCIGLLVFVAMCAQAPAADPDPFTNNFDLVSFLRLSGEVPMNLFENTSYSPGAVITGNRLYVLDTYFKRLYGFDVSSPDKPRKLFALQLGQAFRTMYIKGSYAILSGSPNQLVLLNDTNPTTQTTTIPPGILGMSDSILIVNDTPGRIQFWDITNPTAAYKISSRSAPQYIKVASVAGQLFLIDGFIYDFSNVKAPEKIAANITAQYPYVIGSTGYREDLTIDDLSNPISPRTLGHYEFENRRPYAADPHPALAMNGALAFFTKIDEGLYALDLSDPGSPDFIRGFYRLPDMHVALATANGLVYVFDAYNRSLYILRYTGERPSPSVHSAELVKLESPGNIQSGKTASASVTLRNTGSSAWGGMLGYNLAVNQDPGNLVVDTNSHIAMPDGVTVQPGQEYTFQVPLIGSATTGHYTVQLQMIHEFITVFGPVISFDIDVVSAGNSVQNWTLFD